MRRFLFTCAALALAGLLPSPTMAGDMEDKAIAEQIATILRDSGELQNYSLGVKYKNGTVWLSGRVSSNQQMQAALAVASDIEGIQQIVNSLSISPGNGSSAVPNKNAARKVSATSADFEYGAQGPAGQDVEAAGYHKLAMRHAAKQGRPLPAYAPSMVPPGPAAYDQPHMPNYAWPSYAASPNYAAVTYPKQYSASAFPFIGPFYPYPQVPLGWRKVSLEWDDGWWFLDFYDRGHQ